jgi:hypothetical protein
MRRAVVPYETLSLERAWIARDPLPNPALKYLFPQGVSRGGGASFSGAAYFGEAGIAIVEDVLSAYRISRDTELRAVAAQGTSLDRKALVTIANLAAFYKAPVFTWLDPDRYGQRGAARIRRDLGNLGVDVRNIVSDRDPKLHEPHEIREALET